ncbi:MAG: PHP domain-containing protein [Lachnospiraceae bacterium]|nr:PHP domain-containing protein [Lachnospiraceae bacterium]
MKYDMHCHSKEGSLDARLDIVSYAVLLKTKGYVGMLITDHDSYKGYQHYEERRQSHKLPKVLKDFVVLKGIEYDTRDAGHVIVVLPDGVDCPLLEKKGLKLEVLEQIVHKQGGIMGAAHPYGNGYIAITNTRLYKRNPGVLECFDFIEGYNSTLKADKNELAFELAKKYGKPMTSGSDAHSVLRVGTAYTVFQEKITCNNDLIAYILAHRATEAVGLFHPGLLKKKNPVLRQAGIAGYWVYNKAGMLLRTGARRRFLRKLNLN